MVAIATKAAALLSVIRRQDVEALPPAERRRFADLCRHVAKLAEPRNDLPRAGVLHELRAGRTDE